MVLNNCPRDKYVSIMAVKYCDLPTIRYLLEKDIIKLDDLTARHAIVNKKISVIKYLIEKGCPFTGSDI